MARKKSKYSCYEDVIRYNTQTKYVGEFSAADLSASVTRLKLGERYDNPIRFDEIYIGKIDGDAICNALWSQMSYNPGRWGTSSPFVFNGHNNIMRFCRGREYNVQLNQLRHYLINFMNNNRFNNGKWNDVLRTHNNGYVTIYIQDNGHMNRGYHALANIRDCFRFVAECNVADLRAGGARADEIIANINMRHGPRTTVPTRNNAVYQISIFDTMAYDAIESDLHQKEEQKERLHQSVRNIEDWIMVNRLTESPAEIKEAEFDIAEYNDRIERVTAEIAKLNNQRNNFWKNRIATQEK